MVSHDRPVYQEEHAAQLIMARRRRSPQKGRIHLRRSVDRPFAFPLQSCGGPYISGCSPHIIPTSFDGIHPNEKGYAIVGPLAQAVIDKTLWK
jgi:lysophospholipase L1-like esterase